MGMFASYCLFSNVCVYANKADTTSTQNRVNLTVNSTAVTKTTAPGKIIKATYNPNTNITG